MRTGTQRIRTSFARPAGDLLALFHRSPDLGHAHHGHPLFDVRACRSRDEGATWGPAELVTCDPLGGVIDFGTHTLRDGSIFLHASAAELVPEGPTTPGHTAWSSRPGIPFWIRSRDDGRTWSEPVRFPRLPEGIWGHPAEHSGVSRSQLVELPGGRILLPSKATEQPDGGQPFFGMMRTSLDNGETWEYGGRIAVDAVAHFSEPAIHRTPGGRLLVLLRCHPRQPHDTQCRLALVTSDDDGASWSPWRFTSMQGCPGHLLGLRDGRIFATVGTRWEGQRGCLARGAGAGGRRPGRRPGHPGPQRLGRQRLRLSVGARAPRRPRAGGLLLHVRRRRPRHRGLDPGGVRVAPGRRECSPVQPRLRLRQRGPMLDLELASGYRWFLGVTGAALFAITALTTPAGALGPRRPQRGAAGHGRRHAAGGAVSRALALERGSGGGWSIASAWGPAFHSRYWPLSGVRSLRLGGVLITLPAEEGRRPLPVRLMRFDLRRSAVHLSLLEAGGRVRRIDLVKGPDGHRLVEAAHAIADACGLPLHDEIRRQDR